MTLTPLPCSLHPYPHLRLLPHSSLLPRSPNCGSSRPHIRCLAASGLNGPQGCVPDSFRGDIHRHPSCHAASAPLVGKPTVAPAAMSPWPHTFLGWRSLEEDVIPPLNPLPSQIPIVYGARHPRVAFPRPKDLYALARRIYTCLSPLNMATATLREALALANSGHRLLYDDIEQDIVRLSDLMKQTILHPATKRWITCILTGASNPKESCLDSSESDHSIDRSRPRRRVEPSSGRGAIKRATRRSTSGSDSAQPPPWKLSSRKDNHR